MNTSVATPSTPSTANNPAVSSSIPTPLSPMSLTDLAAQRAALQAQLDMIARAEQDARNAEQERFRERIRNLPVELGFAAGDFTSVYKALRSVSAKDRMTGQTTNVTLARPAATRASGGRGRKGKTEQYADSVKTTAIEMRKGGETIKKISKVLGPSEALLYIWFKDAKLTNKGFGGRAHRTGRKGRNTQAAATPAPAPTNAVHQMAPTPTAVAS